MSEAIVIGVVTVVPIAMMIGLWRTARKMKQDVAELKREIATLRSVPETDALNVPNDLSVDAQTRGRGRLSS